VRAARAPVGPLASALAPSLRGYWRAGLGRDVVAGLTVRAAVADLAPPSTAPDTGS
jgi:hypothetical protein